MVMWDGGYLMDVRFSMTFIVRTAAYVRHTTGDTPDSKNGTGMRLFCICIFKWQSKREGVEEAVGGGGGKKKKDTDRECQGKKTHSPR